MKKTPREMPFEFVADPLHPLELEIKPMFGYVSLYTSGALVLFLRDR